MATLYTEQSKNIYKTWLLMAVFLLVIVVLGWFLSVYYDNPMILYGAVVISLFMNVLSYWYSDKVVLAVAHAKPITREQAPDLWNVVENLSITAGLPMPKVYIIDDPAPNAFATGRDKEHAVVAVTSGLVTMMTKVELEGVVAHELSHIGNRDMLLSTVVVVLVGLVSIASDFFLRNSWRRSRDREEGQFGGFLMLVGVIFTILSPMIATLIQLAISRKREFLADASGALLTRYPEGLASALRKIGAYTQPMRYASGAIAHLFIANPFGAPRSMDRRVSNLFATHPPVEERITALLQNRDRI